MTLRQRLSFVFLMLIALAGGMALRSFMLPEPGLQTVSDGARVEDFSLPDLDGRLRRLSEFAGKTVVLNFWASWCGPCLEEMPAFVDLQNRYRDHGVQFLGVAVDEAAAARKLADQLKLNYPSLVGDLPAMDIAQRLGNNAGVLPYTVLIGPDGMVRAHIAGKADATDLENWLKASAGGG